MKKFNKKVGIMVGSAVLIVGLVALPALAASAKSEGDGFFTQMQTLMHETFTPAQMQQFMNSSAMQNLHNSADMQQAMQNGDFGRMQSLMNSDPNLKAQIGAENVAKMNQIMGRLQGSLNSKK